jgi:RNA polymerase sigma-70 factor (ECF subfamily)
METHGEDETIASVQAGNAADFEYLVHRYQGPLFRIVGNLVDHSMVEDLVQDIFLIAYTKIGSFNPRRGTFRAWIFRIARNRALNARKKKREQLLEENCVIADKRNPSRELMVKEAFTCMDRALSELRFQDRVIFVLAELEGLSYAEIAHIENLALGTVKSRLARIKVKLRSALAPYVNPNAAIIG